MGVSGASRGCPTRDSGGGPSSFGGRFSTFAVGGGCTSRLAANTDIFVNGAIYETEVTSRPERRGTGVCNNTSHRPKLQRVQGRVTDRGKE